MQKRSGSSVAVVDDVVDNSGADDVIDSANDVVNTRQDVTVSDVKLKFLTFVRDPISSGPWKYTFSELKNNTLVDWEIFDATGVDYTSHLETGHELMGDLITEKESNVVYFFFKLTEQNFIDIGGGVIDFDFPSGCLMRAKWQWTETVTAGRWSDQEQIYRLQRVNIPAAPEPFDYSFEVVQTISQVRGKGRALSLRFDSETGKDFHLLGWAIPFTGVTGA
jgi:hypothetical protein